MKCALRCPAATLYRRVNRRRWWTAYYWYSHVKAAAMDYSPMPARDALVETISWLAASPHVSRETRINMHLASDVYRFRAERIEVEDIPQSRRV